MKNSNKKYIITQKVKSLKGTVGNTEWWSEKDWMEHRKNVAKLKKAGEYLKEQEVEISFVHFPIFDGSIERYKDNPKFKVEEIDC